MNETIAQLKRMRERLNLAEKNLKELSEKITQMENPSVGGVRYDITRVKDSVHDAMGERISKLERMKEQEKDLKQVVHSIRGRILWMGRDIPEGKLRECFTLRWAYGYGWHAIASKLGVSAEYAKQLERFARGHIR